MEYGYDGLIQTIDGGYAMAGGTAGYSAGIYDAFLLKTNSLGEIANCNPTMCKSPSANVTSPSATVTSPTATVTSPTATITSPSANNTTIVAP